MSKYDWRAVQRFYDAGRSVEECYAEFGFSNGALHYAVTHGRLKLREAPRSRPRSVTRGHVEQLHALGLSQAEIAAELGVSRPTVCFHMRTLGIAARPELAKRFDWDEIRAYYDAGNSSNQCRARFGFSRSAWADAVKRGAIVPRPRLEPLDQILASGRPRSRLHVKTRLLLARLKEHRCEECGMAEWRSAPLALELHHVNGDGDDNRLENLRLLCPNCHSQTDTWGGRNKAKRARAG